MSSNPNSPNDELMPEYDFSGGVRGKHYQAYRQGHSVTIHKPDGTFEISLSSQVSASQNYLQARAQRSSLQDLHQILAKVPDIEPEAYDRF